MSAPKFWEALAGLLSQKKVFPMLQLVQIEACFSLTSLHWVLHLLFLCVSFLKNCYKMKELVNGEKREIKGDDAITAFLKLKHLTIVHLQKLVKINSWVFLLKINSCELDRFPTFFWGSLGDCPNLNRLPFKATIVNNQGLFD